MRQLHTVKVNGTIIVTTEEDHSNDNITTLLLAEMTYPGVLETEFNIEIETLQKNSKLPKGWHVSSCPYGENPKTKTISELRREQEQYSIKEVSQLELGDVVKATEDICTVYVTVPKNSIGVVFEKAQPIAGHHPQGATVRWVSTLLRTSLVYDGQVEKINES